MPAREIIYRLEAYISVDWGAFYVLADFCREIDPSACTATPNDSPSMSTSFSTSVAVVSDDVTRAKSTKDAVAPLTPLKAVD
jgi:hypothetical protein